MTLPGLGRRIGWLGVLVCVSAPALAVAPRITTDGRERTHTVTRIQRVRISPAEATSAGAAARSFLEKAGGTWTFDVDRRTGRPALVQGSGVALDPSRPGAPVDPESFVSLARRFLDTEVPWCKPPRGDLVLDSRQSIVRDRGRLASAYFQWHVDDVPVEGAYFFVRIGSGRVTQFGTTLIGDAPVETRPALSSGAALEPLLEFSGHRDGHRLDEDPRLVVVPEADGTGGLLYRLVWELTYRVDGQIESWQGRVDARDGSIVSFRDTNRYGQVVGGVYPRSLYEQNETHAPMPAAGVEANGVSVFTDNGGSFEFQSGQLFSRLGGRWVDITCTGCVNPSSPLSTAALGIGWLDFGTGGRDEVGNGFSTPSDRNSYYHITRVRQLTRKWLDLGSWLDSAIRVRTNIDLYCNAYYNGEINLFRSGFICNNTGEIADVIVHEWGHGLDDHTRSGDYATGEGMADVLAMHVTHSPLIGIGFIVDGLHEGAIRHLDWQTSPRGLLTAGNVAYRCPTSGATGPQGAEIHCEGEIYGQTSWDLAIALGRSHGHHTGWRASERLYFLSLPDAGGYLPDDLFPIYDAYLVADDDDGNLANGTPNAAEIFEAFDRHGIAGDPVPASTHCERPEQPNVVVTPVCDGFEIGWDPVPGVDHYELMRMDLREDSPFLPVATLDSTVTTYADIEVGGGVDYWYVVMAVDAAGCESTIENPVAARLEDRPLLTVVAATPDDIPRGNRSGSPDPGEEVDLFLEVTNVGQAGSAAASARVVPLSAGVTMLEDSMSWASLSPDESSVSQTAIRFKTDTDVVPCGTLLEFRLEMEDVGGCPGEPSYFWVRMGQPNGPLGYSCDYTPACFTEPDFDGTAWAAPGESCGEATVAWNPATSNCLNATISYNVYRDTQPDFVPSLLNRVAEGRPAPGFADSLLVPGQVYHYIVRAVDSRSGEDGNTVTGSVTAPSTPDLRGPIFEGIESISPGVECGTTSLSWQPGLETCSLPVSYEVYRSTDPSFVPQAANRIGSTLSTTFVDAALEPGVEYHYVVTSRDDSGLETGPLVQVPTVASQVHDIRFATGFETDDAGWNVPERGRAVRGTWEWGDPEGTFFQPEDDATPDPGTRAWITGLALEDGFNDVDDGITVLVSETYDLEGAADPTVGYFRTFNNQLGGSPNDPTDSFVIEVSNDEGESWVLLEEVSCPTSDSCPVEWIRSEISLNGILAVTPKMRVRFTASDRGPASLVEAGIDEFSMFDRNRLCVGCPLPAPGVRTIGIGRSGNDVVLDWSDQPDHASRYIVYKMIGPAFDSPIRIGTTATQTFVHEGAALSVEDFYYRVTAVDECSNESDR